MSGKNSAFNKFLKTNKFTLLSLIVILGMFVVYILTFDLDVNQTVRGMAGSTKEGYSSGEARIGGTFEVVDHNDNVVTHENLEGQYTLFFFGFTFCPDVCPMSLSKMAEVMDMLTDKQKDQLQVYFVTVDPERDTPEVIKEYALAFHDDFVGLTGTVEQIKDLSKKYLVYAVLHKENEEDTEYMVDHSSYVYLMGTDGKYLTHFRHKETATEIAEKLKNYIYK